MYLKSSLLNYNMERLLTLIMLGMFLMSVSVVSAETLIAGKIYNADYSDTVYNATVEVTCNGNLETTDSLSDGTYEVTYDESNCQSGDDLSVYAVCTGFQCTETDSGNNIVGANTLGGTIHDEVFHGYDLGIVNVPLVPEFGLIIGLLTILSAVGIFFFVRRE